MLRPLCWQRILSIVNAILSILIIVICGILPIVMEVQTKKQFFSINYTNSELENNAFDATATNSGNKGIVDFVMKYDKEAGMERDVLNARPFQRYMPSRYLLQLYNENIDQRYKVTF